MLFFQFNIFIFFIGAVFLLTLLSTNKINYYNLFAFFFVRIFFLSILFLFIVNYSFIINSSSFEFYNTKFLYNCQIIILFFSCLYIFAFNQNVLKNQFTIDQLLIFVLITFLQIFIFNSNNFLLFFILLEGITFLMYILISSKSDSDLFNIKSEVILKYFFINSFSAIIFLFGVLIFFFNFNSIHFDVIYNFSFYDTFSFQFGNFLILVSLLSKIGIFPASFWVSDLYKSLELRILCFVSLIPKTTFILLFFKFCYLFGDILNKQVKLSLLIFLCLTIIQGSIAALTQQKLQAILAFSSLAHSASILLFIININFITIYFFFFYLIIYLSINFWLFQGLYYLWLIQKPFIKNISDLINLNQNSNYFLNFFLFSLICLSGLPPFGIFFCKLSLLIYLLILKEFYIFCLIVITSIISTFYYIRFLLLIKNSRVISSKRKIIQFNEQILTFSQKFIFFSLFFFNIFFFFFLPFFFNFIIFFFS